MANQNVKWKSSGGRKKYTVYDYNTGEEKEFTGKGRKEKAVEYAESLRAEYLKPKEKKLPEPQARIKRLDDQDPSWVGTTQAEKDSADVSAKIPRFETVSQKGVKQKKLVQDKVKKMRTDIAKLQADMDGFNALSDDEKAELSELYPNKLAEIRSKEKQLERKTKHLKKIIKKYPDSSKDPLGLFD